MKKLNATERDIVILGGGISGAAVAYGLLARGCKVTMIDAPTPTNKASRANVGLLWCQSKFLHLPDYARWGFHSCQIFPELTEELEKVSGVKIPVNYQGGLIACLGDKEYEDRGKYIDNLRETLGSYPGGMISRGELEAKLPGVKFGSEVSGAAWCEDDGLIEPLALLHAFRVAFTRLGGELINAQIHDVQPKDGGYRIVTDGGNLGCGKVVLAAGLANRRLARFAIQDLPVTADKAQVLLVERMPFVMPSPVLGLTQTFGGTTIIGFRHESVGHDTGIVPEGVATEGQWAMRVWPEIGKKRLIRAWTGLRIMPKDKQAIYSRLPNHPNATLINTHSAVTFAAVHTRYLPEFILGGELPVMAQGMTLTRFGFEC